MINVPTPVLTDEQVEAIVNQAATEGNTWRAANAAVNAMRDLIAAVVARATSNPVHLCATESPNVALCGEVTSGATVSRSTTGQNGVCASCADVAIAQATKEVAEEIAQGIEAMPIAGFNGETLKWLKIAREECAALARKIGAIQ